MGRGILSTFLFSNLVQLHWLSIFGQLVPFCFISLATGQVKRCFRYYSEAVALIAVCLLVIIILSLGQIIRALISGDMKLVQLEAKKERPPRAEGRPAAVSRDNARTSPCTDPGVFPVDLACHPAPAAVHLQSSRSSSCRLENLPGCFILT